MWAKFFFFSIRCMIFWNDTEEKTIFESFQFLIRPWIKNKQPTKSITNSWIKFSKILLQIIFVLNPEKISGNKILVPAYEELIKYIPGSVFPCNPSKIVNVDSVSNFTLFIALLHMYMTEAKLIQLLSHSDLVQLSQ